MPIWNEMDLLSCLEVLPVVDDYETRWTYSVRREEIRLELTVFKYLGDVHISLYRGESADSLFEMELRDCSAVKYVNDKRGEYLEFAPARCFGSRYDEDSPMPYGVRVAIRPDVSVRLFSRYSV